MAVLDVKLTDPEAHRLADMAGVHQDLRMVAATAAQLSRRREQKAPDMHVLEAMQDLALIRYGRCYKGGVRDAFPIPQEWIDALPAKLRQAHHDFLDLRDKHIAHSVNDWEVNMPVARVHVDEQTNDVTVKAVRVHKYRTLMIGSDWLEKLHRLAVTLADRVYEDIRREEERLLEYAKKIPTEELKRRIKEDRPDWPGQRKVGKRRGR